MRGNANPPVKKLRDVYGFTFDREEDFKDWQRKRERSQMLIGCIGWVMVMTVATVVGFLIGYMAKYGL